MLLDIRVKMKSTFCSPVLFFLTYIIRYALPDPKTMQDREKKTTRQNLFTYVSVSRFDPDLQ